MQLSISTRHGHLGEASQAKLSAKVEKLGRLFDRLTSIELVVDLKDSHRPKVDLIVAAEHKHDFVSHSSADSLQAAVDSAIEKIEQQLRKYKERVQDRHRSNESKRLDSTVILSERDEDIGVGADDE